MDVRVPSKQASKAPKFTGSLVRVVVSVLLVLTTLPILIMGTVNYFRSQTMLKDQMMGQIQLVVDNYAVELEKSHEQTAQIMDSVVANAALLKNIDQILITAPDDALYRANKEDAIAHLKLAKGTIAGRTLSEISILDPTGKVIVSTNPIREGTSYITGRGPSNLLGQKGSAMVFDPSPLFTYRMILYIARPYISPNSDGAVYTIIGANTTTNFVDTLEQAEKFLPDARAYVFTRDNQVIGLASDKSPTYFANNQVQLNALHSVINKQGFNGSNEYNSWGETPVLSYARWSPDGNYGIAIEAPATFVYDQVRAQNTLNIIILAAALLISGIIVWFGSSRMVKPLVTLAGNVQAFAGGDWGRRTQINRKDEIGLLAHTFNQMADELSQLYRSLEQKVEERNKQMRTAVEVSQYATASLNRQEILQRTVDLITDRFGYGYASIYLLDASGTFFTTRTASGPLAVDEANKHIGGRIRAQSLFGMALSERKIRMVDNTTLAENGETLLPGAKSEVVIPISVGDTVVGLLDVQHSTENTFGPDTNTALSMVASQVANGLNNIAQVENAQVDLKETSLLYHASRQISQSKDREEIWKVLDAAIQETPYLGMLLVAREDQLRAARVMEGNSKTSAKVPTIIMTLSRFQESFHAGSYLLFDNLGQPSEYYPILSFFHQRGCTSAALIPIFVDGKLVQVIALAARGSTFTPAAMQQYLNLGEVIANAQERMNVLHAMEASLTELRSLATISQAISVETDINVLYRILLEHIKEVTGGELSFYIALYDRENERIEFPFNYEARKLTPIDPMPFGEGLTSILIKSQKPLLLANNAIQQAAALGMKIVGEPARSWLGVPLSMGGEVFGAMVVQDVDADGRFTEEDLRLFTTIAPQVAVSIRNAQLLSRMQDALKLYDQEHYLLNTLLDNVPDSISFKDEQGRYLLCSKSMYRLRGFENEADLIWKTELDLIPDLEKAQIAYADEIQIIQSGQPRLGNIQETRTPDGKTQWIMVDTLPMKDEDGKVTGSLSIAHDITEMKKAEQLAQLRAQQLLTTSEIARDTSGTLNVEELLEKSINMVRDRFGFYHASIFLLDPLGEYAVLRESTGEAGSQLKAVGHKLGVGSQSIVGQATGKGEPVVVDDVTLSPNYYANPLLPLTRSEMAMPLRMGDRTLGALDVQDTEPNAFQAEDINILRILADQLAIAIFNADLFAETQENVTKHRFLHQITTAAAAATNSEDVMHTTVEGLRTAFGSDRVAIYLFDDANTLTIRASAGYENTYASQERVALGEGIIGLTALGRHTISVKDALAEGQSGMEKDIRSQLAVPIIYSDRVVGVLSIGSYLPAVYNENDQEILGSMGSTLGAMLANAQLVNQIRQQIEQQKQLFDITSKIRRSSDINTILQVSTRELATALHARRAQVSLMARDTVPMGDNFGVGDAELEISGNNGHNGNGNHGHTNDPRNNQELDL